MALRHKTNFGHARALCGGHGQGYLFIRHFFVATNVELGLRLFGRVFAQRIFQCGQALGLIHYTRGHIFIADRAQLLTEACACYFQDRQIYSEIMEGD